MQRNNARLIMIDYIDDVEEVQSKTLNISLLIR